MNCRELRSFPFLTMQEFCLVGAAGVPERLHGGDAGLQEGEPEGDLLQLHRSRLGQTVTTDMVALIY